MKIQVILASTRPNRVGERVAKWVTQSAAARDDMEVELVDLAKYDLPHFNEEISPRMNRNRQPAPEVARWLAKVAEADGYIIVTPEYNHSFPGVLKDALDYVDIQLEKKAVAVVSYGSVGGARAAQELKLVTLAVRAAVVPESLSLTGPASLIDEDGKFIGDASAPYGPTVILGMVLGQLAWWTSALAAARAEKAVR